MCGAALPAGADAWWDSEVKAATCEQCYYPVAAAGIAGASAAREHERRAGNERRRKEEAIADDAAWRAQVKADHPLLGRFAAAVSPKPQMTPESQATRAWAHGAAGEERVAEILAGCDGVLPLHDRRIPGTKANIDHIAVGPAGVFVIDAKKYSGKIEKRDRGGWLRSDIRLYVAGRDRTKLVRGMVRQLEIVRAALDESVPVRAILCFVGVEWPGFRMRPIDVGGVTAVWPLKLAEVVTAPGELTPDDMRRVASALRTALPSA